MQPDLCPLEMRIQRHGPLREVKLGLMSAHDRLDVLESINQDSSLMGTCCVLCPLKLDLALCHLIGTLSWRYVIFIFILSPLLYFVHFIFFVVLGVDSGSPTLCIV